MSYRDREATLEVIIFEGPHGSEKVALPEEHWEDVAAALEGELYKCGFEHAEVRIKYRGKARK